MAKDLKMTADKLKSEVHDSFARLYKTIRHRERQVLRQIDVLWQQCEQTNTQDKKSLDHFGIKFDNENKLLEDIMKYGELDLSNFALDSDLYVIEDYICPKIDHECMYKCIDTLDISSTDDLNVKVEFPQCKNINLSFNDTKITNHSDIEYIDNIEHDNANKMDFPNISDSFTFFSDKSIESPNESASESHNDFKIRALESPDVLEKRYIKDNKYSKIENSMSISPLSSEPSSPGNDSRQKIENGNHPTQVQHWLNQIISETEFEPIQNIEKEIVMS